MDKIATAVLHCSLNEPKKVIEVGKKVRDNLYNNTTEYATPPISEAAFIAQVLAADNAQAATPGGGTQATAHRNTEVRKLFTMLNPTTINYVNSLYKGNAEALGKSGFDVLAQTTPHTIPEQLVIKRIVNGPVDHSAKIFIESTKGPLEETQEDFTYIVQMSDDQDEANFHTVLTTTNRHELVITDLTRGKPEYMRVAAHNAHGTGLNSDPVGFISQ